METTSKANLDAMESWRVLHEWAREVMNREGLTIREFLETFGIEPRQTYIQYLSVRSGDRCPSTKIGTVGKTLRDALTNAKNSSDRFPLVSRSAAENFVNDYWEHQLTFISKGIESMRLENDTIKIFVENSISEQDIKKMFPEVENEKIDVLQISTLALACKSGVNFGTIWALNFKPSPALVTASHVLTQSITSTTTTFQRKQHFGDIFLEIVTTTQSSLADVQVLTKITENSLFGAQIVHDINIILPKVSFKFHGSLDIAMITVPQIYDDLLTPQKNAKIYNVNVSWLDVKVWKIGHTTGKTEGLISFANENHLEIYSDQQQPFALPGDSGSALMCDFSEGGVIGIIVKVITLSNGSTVVRAIPLWSFIDFVEDEMIKYENDELAKNPSSSFEGDISSLGL